MSFTFLEKMSDQFTWPVKIKFPVDGKKYKEVEIIAVFHRFDNDKLKEIHTASKRKDEDGVEYLSFKEYVIDVLDSIRAKNDEGEIETLPNDLYERVLGIPGAYHRLFNAHNEAISGEKAKN